MRDDIDFELYVMLDYRGKTAINYDQDRRTFPEHWRHQPQAFFAYTVRSEGMKRGELILAATRPMKRVSK